MRPADCTNCRMQPLDLYIGPNCPMCGARIINSEEGSP